MFSRINILKIFEDHYSTLRRFDTNKESIYWKDYVLFFLIPTLVSIGLTITEYSIKEYIGYMMAATSIFGGFLFNLMAIIYSQIDKLKKDAQEEDDKIKKRFVKEIHINISYTITLSLLIVIALLLCTFPLPAFKFDLVVKDIALCLVYFLLIHFFLTLLMVVYRVYILLNKAT